MRYVSKVLVIVESPAKAKTIGRFLGRKYWVKSSMGHVRDLPKSQFGVDIANDFEPKYITIRGKGDILKELRDAAQKASGVLLASDPDREGEAIAWHLQQVLKVGQKEPCRIQFNEITKNSIQEAIKHPRPINMSLVNAQQARRILDRLVGYNLSPLLWRKIKKGLSAGRVQSVAVKLICDREEEINEFVPEEYWSITAVLSKPGTQIEFEAKLTKEKENNKISSKEQADHILAALKQVSFVVAKVQKREKKRNPAPPFITSTLQQEAYRKLGFTARKTMRLAQQLYEGIDLGNELGSVGLITYIRTDSTRVATIAQEDARQFIKEKFGSEFVPKVPNQYAGKKGAQDAHEAIRPTSIYRTPEEIQHVLSRDQYRLYKLIWDRFAASQMSQAVFDTTTIDIAAGDFTFRTTGSIIKFPGFMQVYIEGKDEQGDKTEELKSFPALEEGQKLRLLKVDSRQHFTQPPPRYSEATLVKTLEELGIGRPSTYAPIIDTILARGYVIREQKQFFPTELGIVVTDLLKEYFPEIVDVEFTASLEEKLDAIEEGHLSWKGVIRDFYTPFEQMLDRADHEISQIEIEEEVTEEICEKCGRNMVIKMGRYGKFLACPGFPECRTTKPFLEEIGVTCPRCGGQIVKRRSKKGRTFYGCSNYPDCEYVSWDKPTNEQCPQCGERLVEKTSRKKGTRLVCPNDSCFFQKAIENPS